MRVLWLSLTLGCSLSNLDVAECTTDLACRSVFGLGSVCDEEGYCSQTGLHPRCSTTPSDLFEEAEENLDTIVLGHLWRNQSFDVEQRSVQLAIIHANDTEGLDGRPYGLVSCDTESLPEVDDLDGEEATEEMAAYLAEQLALPAIVGATSSPETEAAYSVTNSAGTLLISPSSTSPALTSLDGLSCSNQEPGLLWRTVPPDELQGQVIAQDMDARDVKNIAVIYEEGSYGEGLADAIDDFFAGEQLTRIAFADESGIGEAAVNAGNTPGVTEVVFITSSVDFVSAFLSAAAPLEAYIGMGIFLADAAYNQSIYDDLNGSDAENLFSQIRGTRPTIDEDSSVLQTFVASYAVEFDGEDATSAGFSAYAYDAGWLAIYGSAWAVYQAQLNGLGMARGLRQISSGDQVTIQSNSWNEIRAFFEQGESVDLVGASGQLDYDEDTCETSAPIEIWRLVRNKNGDWELATVDIVE